jgi:simple sugar transport system substrate-binding protein
MERGTSVIQLSKRKKVLAVSVPLVVAAAVAVAATATAGSTPAAKNAGALSTAGKRCAGVKIVFFPGGPPGGVFAVNVYNGAKAAASDLGANVQYVWSDWDPAKMVSQFKDALGTKPAGIAIMGHPGDAAFKPLVQKAEAKGIIVTSQNTELPTIEAAYAARGFGYVGQGLYASGYKLGAQTARIAKAKKGDRALVWGMLSQPTRGLRTKGAIDALKKAGLKVDYLEINSQTNADPSAGVPTFTGYVTSHSNVKLVILDHGGLTATAQTYLKAVHKGPNDITVGGFDLSPATVSAIQGGWTDVVLDQQEWLQGYLPVLQICLTKLYKFAGLHIDTGSGFVDKSNVAAIAPLVKRLIR